MDGVLLPAFAKPRRYVIALTPDLDALTCACASRTRPRKMRGG